MKDGNIFLASMAMILLGFLNLNCAKNPTEIIDNNQNEIPAQMPQVDIPWPSLANSPWPMYLHDPQHTGRSPYRGPQEGKVEWMFETGNSVYSSPAIGGDGAIYFGSDDGFFYAVDPQGNLKWKFSTDGLIIQSSPLISSDGTIYFSAWNAIKSQLYAISLTGTLRWKVEVTGLGGEWPLLISKDGQTIYTGDVHQSVFALDATNGIKVWELNLPVAYVSAISPDGSTVYWGTYNGNLNAIDINGTVKWRFAADGQLSYPCIDNSGNVYFNATNYCYSLSPDGTLRWKYPRQGLFYYSSPSIGKDGTIYILGNAEKKLIALDYSGRNKWEFDLKSVGGTPYEKRSENTPIIDADGTIYLGTLTERADTDTLNFIAIHSDGRLKYAMRLASHQTPETPLRYLTPDIDSTPAISADGRIYVGSDRPQGIHLYRLK